MLISIRGRARGVTLLELLVVLMILSIILTAAVKTWDVTLERGRAETTSRKLNQLVNVIVGEPDYIVAGHRADFGFVGDVGRLPNNLEELMVFPGGDSSRWRGPYLRATFNESPDGYRIDGWGDTIIYNKDSLFLRSYGGRGYADRTRWQTVFLPYSLNDLTNNTLDGQIVDVRGASPLNAQPPARRDSILTGLKVTLYYPIEGKLTGLELRLAEAAQFTYTGIPQGTHRLVALYANVYNPPVESTMATADVTVYPGLGAHDVTLRLNVDWNSEP